ncbi:long-chain-fatty-acid--CoA ligase [Streptomyces pactum]|uniref:long-chain-fatty-acid--CoA ligase n=1 Tax=Streptomyces pactum TaxID=68249 RepID=UPI0036F4EC79
MTGARWAAAGGAGAADLPRTVAGAAARHARVRPDRVAVECEGRTVSFRRLHLRSNRTAHALLAAGVGPGTRVAHLAADSEHTYDLLLACAKTGAVLVPVDPRLAPGEIGHVLRDSGCELLFVAPELRPVVERLRPAPPRLRTLVTVDASAPGGGPFRTWQAELPDIDPPAVVDPGLPLAQLYTSGTTGAPKGVVLSRRSFWAVHDLLARHRLDWLDWREDDRSLGVLPVHHVGGPWWFLQGFRVGATLVLARGFDARRILGLIRSGGVSVALLVPSMLQILLDEPAVTPADFRGLRKVVYGGAPIPEPLLTRCLEVMGCAFAQIYGLTETCASAVCLPPEDHVPGGPRLSAAGRPYPGVVVQAVDERGRPLPDGEVGELRISTPAVMEGYWRRPAATAEALVDGWLYTGDAGRVDADGYVYIQDRIKDMVLVAGENVYPAEVEHALRGHPSVADAAVTGVPDRLRGERVHAWVVPGPGGHPSPRELREFLRHRLADYKVPTTYGFVAELPRTASGKVLRRALRDRHRGG